MKVFKQMATAVQSVQRKEKFFLNSECPYDDKSRLCGNWCALFYLERAVKTAERNTSAMVILGCKAGEKNLYVNEIIGD